MAVSNDVLEEKYNNMKEQNEKDHKRLFKLISDFIESADKKYASKLTEKLVYATAGMMLSSIVLAIIYLVIKN